MRYAYVLSALFFATHTFAFSIPQPDGFVTDSANVLTAQQERSLEIDLQNYRGETSNEIAVLIVPSLDGEDIADTAVQVGREWGVGSKDNENGILLLIAVEDRQVFIAVGYGLEGAVPDLAAKQIIEREITPQFKEGKYFEGIEAGIAALKAQIGGEYTAANSTDTEVSDMLVAAAIPLVFIAVFVLFMLYKFFIGMLVTISPSASWWEGAFLGGMFGFFFGGVMGLIGLAFVGGFIDFLVSTIFAKSQRYRTFIEKAKKKMKTKKGGWFIGGGKGGGGGFGGGGGGGFGGGSFGGGGAGGRW